MRGRTEQLRSFDPKRRRGIDLQDPPRRNGHDWPDGFPSTICPENTKPRKPQTIIFGGLKAAVLGNAFRKFDERNSAGNMR
jgi:hypothetical protein